MWEAVQRTLQLDSTHARTHRRSAFRLQSKMYSAICVIIQHVANVIWQRPHRTHSPSHPVLCFLGPRSLSPKHDDDPFSRFCTARPRNRQTDGLQTVRLTDAYATGSSLAIVCFSCILCSLSIHYRRQKLDELKTMVEKCTITTI